LNKVTSSNAIVQYQCSLKIHGTQGLYLMVYLNTLNTYLCYTKISGICPVPFFLDRWVLPFGQYHCNCFTFSKVFLVFPNSFHKINNNVRSALFDTWSGSTRIFKRNYNISMIKIYLIKSLTINVNHTSIILNILSFFVIPSGWLRTNVYCITNY